MQNEKRKEIKYFSMFTGVGGFELGFENSGNKSNNETNPFNCVGVSEIDKYSNQVLRYRFPKIKNYGNAKEINPGELPDFDLLCGGFPCQTFSIAGKRRGFEDTRGTMFFEIARILEVKRPSYILLENVKGLLSHQKGETFRVILERLEGLGYNVEWMVLNSKFFGVPQNRERVFIIGSLGGKPRPEILPFRESSKEAIELQEQQIHPSITGAIGRQGSSSEYKKSLAIVNSITTGILKDRQGSYISESKFTPQKIIDINQGQRVYSTEGTSVALKGLGGGQGAKTGLYEIENMKIRRPTPKECERLQGFPDGWTKYGINEKGETVELSDTQRYKQMGNAVTVNVIEAIANKFIDNKN